LYIIHSFLMILLSSAKVGIFSNMTGIDR